MKSDARVLLSALICFGLLIAGLAADDSVHYQIDARLLVYDGEAASDSLVDWLDDEGGYFLVLREGFIEGRLPAEKVNHAADFLKNEAEELLDYSLTAQDLSAELRRLEASLSSREEVLDRNLEFLDDADFSSTLAIEKEVLQLIQEIESLRGQLAVARNRIDFASIRLQLKNTAITPQAGGDSNFSWINSLDFYRFIAREPAPRAIQFLPRFGAPDSAPEGFSLYRRSRDFMAISPEGIRIASRRIKPEPAMAVEFWEKAVRNHLVTRGYEPRGASRSIGEDRGFTMMWLLPYAGEEYLYSFAVIDRGKRLEIIESGGPLEAYDRRRASIESWIESRLE